MCEMQAVWDDKDEFMMASQPVTAVGNAIPESDVGRELRDSVSVVNSKSEAFPRPPPGPAPGCGSMVANAGKEEHAGEVKGCAGRIRKQWQAGIQARVLPTSDARNFLRSSAWRRHAWTLALNAELKRQAPNHPFATVEADLAELRHSDHRALGSEPDLRALAEDESAFDRDLRPAASVSPIVVETTMPTDECVSYCTQQGARKHSEQLGGSEVEFRQYGSHFQQMVVASATAGAESASKCNAPIGGRFVRNSSTQHPSASARCVLQGAGSEPEQRPRGAAKYSVREEFVQKAEPELARRATTESGGAPLDGFLPSMRADVRRFVSRPKASIDSLAEELAGAATRFDQMRKATSEMAEAARAAGCAQSLDGLARSIARLSEDEASAAGLLCGLRQDLAGLEARLNQRDLAIGAFLQRRECKTLEMQLCKGKDVLRDCPNRDFALRRGAAPAQKRPPCDPLAAGPGRGHLSEDLGIGQPSPACGLQRAAGLGCASRFFLATSPRREAHEGRESFASHTPRAAAPPSLDSCPPTVRDGATPPTDLAHLLARFPLPVAANAATAAADARRGCPFSPLVPRRLVDEFSPLSASASDARKDLRGSRQQFPLPIPTELEKKRALGSRSPSGRCLEAVSRSKNPEKRMRVDCKFKLDSSPSIFALSTAFGISSTQMSGVVMAAGA